MVNWNFLETFIILSENLSFSETARVLNTAQPVVSRQIRVLESNLGYALFTRTKKQVRLSQEGMELKMRLGPLIVEIKRTLLERQSPGSLLKGTIRVGSMYEAGEKLLLPIIAKCLDQNPELTIHTTLMSTVQATEMILKGLLDFAFVYQLTDRKSVQAFPVMQDTPILIADKKMAKTWRQQDELRLVCYREKDTYAMSVLEKALSKQEMKRLRIVASVNSHGKMIEMVRKQKLIAAIPQSSAQEFIDRDSIEVVFKEKKPQDLYIICNEQVLIDKKKKMFLDFVIQEFKKS